MSNTLMIHSSIESSFKFQPDRKVWYHPDGTEAYGNPHPDKYLMQSGTVLEFLVSYDWRGSNRFQEEENLEFLRLYIHRYPEVAEWFVGIGPTYWEDI